MNKNKKGISAIVATVLIILITVAAVTIVWAAVIPMINNNLEGATLCYDAVSQLSIQDAGYTCYNSSATTLNVQLKRGAGDFDLANVQFLISTGGNTVTRENVVTASNLLSANEEHVYVITGITDAPESVQIAPMLSVGNTIKTCDVSASIEIRAC